MKTIISLSAKELPTKLEPAQALAAAKSRLTKMFAKATKVHQSAQSMTSYSGYADAKLYGSVEKILATLEDSGYTLTKPDAGFAEPLMEDSVPSVEPRGLQLGKEKEVVFTLQTYRFGTSTTVGYIASSKL